MEEKLINEKSGHGELWVDVSSSVAVCSPQKRIAAALWPCPEMVVLELSLFPSEFNVKHFMLHSSNCERHIHTLAALT